MENKGLIKDFYIHVHSGFFFLPSRNDLLNTLRKVVVEMVSLILNKIRKTHQILRQAQLLQNFYLTFTDRSLWTTNLMSLVHHYSRDISMLLRRPHKAPHVWPQDTPSSPLQPCPFRTSGAFLLSAAPFARHDLSPLLLGRTPTCSFHL